MRVPIQRPILVGGIALAGSWWLLDVLGDWFGELGNLTIVAGLAGVGGWWLKSRMAPLRKPLDLPPPKLTVASIQQTLTDVEQMLQQIQAEADQPDTPLDLAQYRDTIAQITAQLERTELRMIVLGEKGTGKTTVCDRLHPNLSDRAVTITEAPSFSATSVLGLGAEAIAREQAMSCDLIVLLVSGDLTASEWSLLQQIAPMKRSLVVLNKQDQYLPEEQGLILNQLRERVKTLIPSADVVAIAADPRPVKVRRYAEDGSVQEWMEEQPADLAALNYRLNQVITEERQQLVLASSLSTAETLKTQTKSALNEGRRSRAIPIVERYQWLSAGAAFVSPMPTVDVIATLAINAQMIVDLGKIYHQSFSLQQAQKMATSLGALLVKLGLVELSSQAIAGFLKTTPVTFVAGGCVQGLSAAYLTRVTGLSLIEFFSTQSIGDLSDENPLAMERFGSIVKTVFQQNQKTALLKSFMTQAMEKLSTYVQPTHEVPPSELPTPLEPLKIPSPVISLAPKPEMELIESNRIESTESTMPLKLPT